MTPTFHGPADHDIPRSAPTPAPSGAGAGFVPVTVSFLKRLSFGRIIGKLVTMVPFVPATVPASRPRAMAPATYLAVTPTEKCWYGIGPSRTGSDNPKLAEP